MKKKEIEFLKESNAIEGVYDKDSLQQAAFAWEYLKGQDEINTSVILKTHKILMLHSNLYPNERGYFRKCPVWVAGREGAPWQDVEALIKAWCIRGNLPSGSIDPKALHVEYERIHPFVDGNGRTGRMFMNWQLIKKLKQPIMIIHEGKEQWEYYEWFR